MAAKMSVAQAKEFLSQIKEKSVAGKSVLVIGGTAGIGKGIAIQFATLGAKVIISGRSKESAELVLQSLNEINPNQVHSFRRVDLSLVKNALAFAKSFEAELLDYVVISAGAIELSKQETEEGLDKILTLIYYSRFAILKTLADTFVARGLPLRCMVVMNPNLASKFHGKDGDFDMKEKSGMTLKPIMNGPLYNSLMVESLAAAYPSLSFTHAFPGAVNTELMANSSLPWGVRHIAAFCFRIVSKSIDHCAALLVAGFLADERVKGCHFMDEDGSIIVSSHQTSLKDDLWEFTIKQIDRISAISA